MLTRAAKSVDEKVIGIEALERWKGLKCMGCLWRDIWDWGKWSCFLEKSNHLREYS